MKQTATSQKNANNGVLIPTSRIKVESSSDVHADKAVATKASSAPAPTKQAVLTSMLKDPSQVTGPPVSSVAVRSPGQAAVPRLAYILQQKSARSQPPITLMPTSGSTPGSTQTVYLMPAPQNSLVAQMSEPAHQTTFLPVKSLQSNKPNGMMSDVTLPMIQPAVTVAYQGGSVRSLSGGRMIASNEPAKEPPLIALASMSVNNPARSVGGLVFSRQSKEINGEKSKEFLCNFCKFRVSSYPMFSLHLSGHIFKCNHCSFKAFTRYEVIIHRQEQHPQFRNELVGYQGIEVGDMLGGGDSSKTPPAAAVPPTTVMPAPVVQPPAAMLPLIAQPPVAIVPRTEKNDCGDVNYFTYKIHEYQNRGSMYECDICLYMTHELYDMYNHATTHTLEDMRRGGASAVATLPSVATSWGCFFCPFTATRQADVVAHLKVYHMGKELKMRRIAQKEPEIPPPPQQIPPPATPPPPAPVTPAETHHTMWGCYYCPEFQTAKREAAVKHVQQNHRGQKLMITRRRIVARAASTKVPDPESTTPAVDTGPELKLQIENTRSLSTSCTDENGDAPSVASPTDESTVAKTTEESHGFPPMKFRRYGSKYDDMIDFLNKSSNRMQQQLMDVGAEAANASPIPDDANSSHCSEVTDEGVTPAVKGYAEVIYKPDPQDERDIDVDQYMTYDVKTREGLCKVCGFKRISKCAYSHMREHIMVHTGERIWGCPYCKYHSNRRQALYRHVVSQHSDCPVRLVRHKPYLHSTKRVQVVAGVEYRQLDFPYDLPQPTSSPKRHRLPLRGPRCVREDKILRSATQIYKCGYCSRSSVFKVTIVAHMKYAHPAQEFSDELVTVHRRPDVSSELKEVILEMIRSEDMHHFGRLQELVNVDDDADSGESDVNTTDIDVDDSVDTEPTPSEVPILPNSTESGKYQCPYCIYRTFRPLIVKQHILCRHPGSEIVITDLRCSQNSKRKEKMLYLCALPSCTFMTPVKHALYAHIGKNPQHAGVPLSEVMGISDSTPAEGVTAYAPRRQPLSKISRRCSSLRSATHTEPSEPQRELTLDALIVAMEADLASGVPNKSLLLKCSYCDMPSTYDTGVLKEHLIATHSRCNPVVLDVRAYLQGKPHRVLVCPMLACNTIAYDSALFKDHLKNAHKGMVFHMPLVDLDTKKLYTKRKLSTKQNYAEESTPKRKRIYNKKRYRCSHCPQRCVSLEVMHAHLVMRHMKKRLLLCRDPPARGVHKPHKIFFCHMCHFHTRVIHELNEHKCSGRTVGYQCSNCESCTLTDLLEIEEHVLTVHDCEIGGYTEVGVKCGYHKVKPKSENVDSNDDVPLDHFDEQMSDASSTSKDNSHPVYSSPERSPGATKMMSVDTDFRADSPVNDTFDGKNSSTKDKDSGFSSNVPDSEKSQVEPSSEAMEWSRHVTPVEAPTEKYSSVEQPDGPVSIDKGDDRNDRNDAVNEVDHNSVDVESDASYAVAVEEQTSIDETPKHIEKTNETIAAIDVESPVRSEGEQASHTDYIVIGKVAEHSTEEHADFDVDKAAERCPEEACQHDCHSAVENGGDQNYSDSGGTKMDRDVLTSAKVVDSEDEGGESENEWAVQSSNDSDDDSAARNAKPPDASDDDSSTSDDTDSDTDAGKHGVRNSYNEYRNHKSASHSLDSE